MGKAKEASKEAKKQPTKTPKEKKAAKQAKKHGSTNTPLVGSHWGIGATSNKHLLHVKLKTGRHLIFDHHL